MISDVPIFRMWASMFIVSKLIWIFFNPATLFTLALLFAAFQAWRRRWRSVRRWLAGLTFVAVALMILPVGDWALYPLETRFRQLQRPGPLAGVIVLVVTGKTPTKSFIEIWTIFCKQL